MIDYIGIEILYNDYLGYERPGKIAWIEPYTGNVLQDESEGAIVWVYIIDDDPEYNLHQIDVGGITINYAELRLSNEITIQSIEIEEDIK